MSADPETIMAALLAQLTANIPLTFSQTGIAKIGRRAKFSSSVNPNENELWVCHVGDHDQWPQLGFQYTAMKAELWLNVKTPGPNDVPDTNLNAGVKLIRAAMAAMVAESNTLGGLVQYARVEGESQYYPGDIGDTGIAVIPVSIGLNPTYP